MTALHIYREAIGWTVTEVEQHSAEDGVTFKIRKGEETGKIRMFHSQDCCEQVYLEEVIGGELSDLVGEEIMVFEKTSSEGEPPPNRDGYEPDSYTWTFYKIRTNRLTLTLRWLGTSNGYYSEDVHVDIRHNGQLVSDWMADRS